MALCSSCGLRPAAATLQRRTNAGPPGSVARGKKRGSHALCSACVTWLRQLVVIARQDRPGHGIIGAPRPSASRHIFGDQCHLCLAVAGSAALLVELSQQGTFTTGWPALVLCPSCDAWLAGMASDGRSARGLASRAVDGAYGRWLHPNLREMALVIDVRDREAHRVILEAARAMEVRVLDAAANPGDRVARFFELPLSEPAPADDGTWRAEMALAPFGQLPHLRDVLEDGATDWLTLPLTPQQAAAGLLRALRHGDAPLVFDPDTLLPLAAGLDPRQRVLGVIPASGQDRAELAWLLRRHCRGYDDIALAAGGDIVVIPRAPVAQFDEIAQRLASLLEGRCRIRPREAPNGRSRLDVAG